MGPSVTVSQRMPVGAATAELARRRHASGHVTYRVRVFAASGACIYQGLADTLGQARALARRAGYQGNI